MLSTSWVAWTCRIEADPRSKAGSERPIYRKAYLSYLPSTTHTYTTPLSPFISTIPSYLCVLLRRASSSGFRAGCRALFPTRRGGCTVNAQLCIHNASLFTSRRDICLDFSTNVRARTRALQASIEVVRSAVLSSEHASSEQRHHQRRERSFKHPFNFAQFSLSLNTFRRQLPRARLGGRFMWDRGSTTTAATMPLAQPIQTCNCGSRSIRHCSKSADLYGFPRF